MLVESYLETQHKYLLSLHVFFIKLIRDITDEIEISDSVEKTQVSTIIMYKESVGSKISK